jgi:hypothetical protein
LSTTLLLIFCSWTGSSGPRPSTTGSANSVALYFVAGSSSG